MFLRCFGAGALGWTFLCSSASGLGCRLEARGSGAETAGRKCRTTLKSLGFAFSYYQYYYDYDYDNDYDFLYVLPLCWPLQ